MKKVTSIVPVVILCAGCATPFPHKPESIYSSVAALTGYRPPIAQTENAVPDLELPDGPVSESDAVAFSLANNPAFLEDLAQLGISRADVLEAGMLRNPVLSLLFPRGPKQLEANLAWPIEELWQRPARLAAARLDADKIADNLVLHGLKLILDVRVAFAESGRQSKRHALLTEAAQLATQIADITRLRYKAGDISELDAAATAIDALHRKESALHAERDASIATNQLWSLMGLAAQVPALKLDIDPVPSLSSLPLEKLLKMALAARPDLRAAELGIDAAGKRAGLERAKILKLVAVLDSNRIDGGGYETGPGLQWEIPLFNRNDGGRARAHAQLDVAARHYTRVRKQILREVHDSQARYVSASHAYRLWDTEIMPALEAARTKAQDALGTGDISYLSSLITRQQWIEGQLAYTDSDAELRKARAQLAYSIGRTLPGQRSENE